MWDSFLAISNTTIFISQWEPEISKLNLGPSDAGTRAHQTGGACKMIPLTP